MNQSKKQQDVFHVIMIRPTRYGPDGYPLQWYKTVIPSNTLSCIYALVEDCQSRQVLGEDVKFVLHPIDETSCRVQHDELIRMIRADGGKGLVMIVGVQSNQFPRATDLAIPFVKNQVPVCIGGFHVSGCLAMFGELPPEIKSAQDLGISFFAGEAEGQRLDKVLQDAYADELLPLYNHLNELPSLENEPPPFIPRERTSKVFDFYSTMDLGRGCPFGCSFCTVINVQGRKSRTRSADDLEAFIRRTQADRGAPPDRSLLVRWYFKTTRHSTHSYFLTDDNFSRNANWEALLDRLIMLRETEGIKVRLQIQVDTKCHKIPGFIEKCAAAGVDQVFIGVENIRPDNLAEVNKGHNQIEEYRESIMAWKKYPVVIYAAYIIGFPKDTRESVLEDVETIKRELPVDLIHFTILTPLPGSEDHLQMAKSDIWMDPDLNKYALCNRVTEHPLMTIEEWESVYEAAYDCFYTEKHVETILKRMVALGSNKKRITTYSILLYANVYKAYGIHPLEAGFLRLKRRKDRRPGVVAENPALFYSKYSWEMATFLIKTYRAHSKLRKKMRTIWTDPNRFNYSDDAINR